MNAVSVLQAASTFVINGVLAWLCGSLLTRHWLAAAEPGLGPRCDAALGRGERYALCAAIAGGAAAMWSAFAAMAGLPLQEVGGVAADILAGTALGRSFLLAMGALVLAALARVLDWHAAVCGALLIVFAFSRAQVSHAAGDGPFSLAVLADAVHLLLIGVWLGCVAIAAWLAMPAAGAQPPLLYMQRLSALATIALGGLVLSGVYGAWQRLGAPERLFDTFYGTVLSVKLVLFAAALALGAWNRFVGFPAAGHDAGRGALLVLRVESLFLLGALACAAVLTQQRPPA